MASSMEVTRGTLGQILCCECGLAIEPNPSNMCVSCIRSRVDITDGIPKTGVLQSCKFCERYFHPPNAWTYAELESKELLAVCLKKLKAPLTKVRLVDAGFIWTEPHSKRVRVKLTIQKEIQGGAVLEQAFPVEFTVQGKMCEDCVRIEAKDYWRACVQLRQKTEHKKTLFYVEQLILKHQAHKAASGMKQVLGGMDFFFAKQGDARRLVEFLLNLLPARVNTAKELVSQDEQNNTYDYKHTWHVEIVPVCKDQVVCLPKALAQSLGNFGQVAVCLRVHEVVVLIDPTTAQMADVSATAFWRTPFEALCGPRQLVEYTVIDVEEVGELRRGAGHSQVSTKHVLADVWVQKSSELGRSDVDQMCVRSHLGHLLHPGDAVLGLDLAHCNRNNATLDAIPEHKRPNVVLVKKVYDKVRRNRKRRWQLKRLEGEKVETESLNNDYADFMEDLEDDPSARHNVNIYRKPVRPDAVSQASSVVDQDEFPQVTALFGLLRFHHHNFLIFQISLQEMLDDLVIEDDPMGE